MRHQALRFTDALDADLADAEDVHGIETEALIALASDARVADNELPAGVPNRGWWADRFDPSGEQTGSRLWLLESVVATPDNARRAEDYALEALAYLVRSGRARAIRPLGEVVGERLLLRVSIVLRSGQVAQLDPLRVNASTP
jgi:phage gp46-like protein